MNDFYNRVYQVVKKIPKGKVASYGQIAWMLGHPRRARMVGRAAALGKTSLPWHRVVMSDGKVAGGEGAELRQEMLKSEGAVFLPDGKVDMKASRWVVVQDDAE